MIGLSAWNGRTGGMSVVPARSWAVPTASWMSLPPIAAGSGWPALCAWWLNTPHGAAPRGPCTASAPTCRLAVGAALIAQPVCSYWRIENGLHRVLENTLPGEPLPPVQEPYGAQHHGPAVYRPAHPACPATAVGPRSLPGANACFIGGVEHAEPQTIRLGGSNGMDCPAQHSTTGPGIADHSTGPAFHFQSSLQGNGLPEGRHVRGSKSQLGDCTLAARGDMNLAAAHRFAIRSHNGAVCVLSEFRAGFVACPDKCSRNRDAHPSRCASL